MSDDLKRLKEKLDAASIAGEPVTLNHVDAFLLSQLIKEPPKFTLMELSEALTIVEAHEQRPETGMMRAYEYLTERAALKGR